MLWVYSWCCVFFYDGIVLLILKKFKALSQVNKKFKKKFKTFKYVFLKELLLFVLIFYKTILYFSISIHVQFKNLNVIWSDSKQKI